ncbi:MAG: hypothetical protein M3285_05610 [Actinomycetota bacterium]|nr:hypothetical protein [Actinomycetota bacterium]
MSGDRPPRVDIQRTGGNPTEAEQRAIIAALEMLIEEERRGAASSLWKRAGRAQGRRLGMSDYRDRFSHEDAWRLSARFPYGGREYPGLLGRGDAR